MINNDIIDASECVVATAFGNIDGLSEAEQLVALRMAASYLKDTLTQGGSTDELQRLKASHAKLSEQVKEARRVIALYRRWEQAGDIEVEKDVDIDSGSMLIEASFAAIAFQEKWEGVINASNS